MEVIFALDFKGWQKFNRHRQEKDTRKGRAGKNGGNNLRKAWTLEKVEDMFRKIQVYKWG